MNVRGKKVFVGLSGGVDSAVSAALLKRAGAQVTGVFIKGWYPPGMPCTWAADRRDAMRVAARLQIPFITLDASAEYKKSVIDYLLSEYREGRTPNPDIMCNREVKFGVFYRFARDSGADAIATGHYLSGDKDQRYFLWAVPKEILAATVFPVGHLDKAGVRARARKLGLPVADKRDSQGICFLGSVSVDEFLESEFGVHPGQARTEEGVIVGEHDGALHYTIGQRVALRPVHGGTQEQNKSAWFVRAKDVAHNVLVVRAGHESSAGYGERTIRFSMANWFQEQKHTVEAQYRYRGPRVSGHLELDRFISDAPLTEPPVPGQSVVCYDENNELVGGGIILA